MINLKHTRKTALIIALITPLISGCSTQNLTTAIESAGHFEANLIPLQNAETLLYNHQEHTGTHSQALLNHPLTAKTAIKLTLLENQDLKAQWQNIGIKQADLMQAGLLKNPMIELSTLFAEHGGSANITAALLTSLSDLLQKPFTKKIAAHDLEREKLRIAALLIAKASETHKAYINHQSAIQKAHTVKTSYAIRKAALKLSTELLNAGNISQYEHDQRANALHLAYKDKLTATSEVKQTRAQLNEAMGLAVADQNKWRITTRLPPLPNQNISPHKTKQIALQNSLAIAMARQDLLRFAAKHQLQRQKNIIPDLDLGVEFERNEGEKEVGPLAELTIPIFDHGQARRLKADYELKQREANLTAAIRKTAQRATYLAEKRRDEQKLLTHYDQNIVPSAKRVQQGALKQYNAMQKGAFALLDAKHQTLNLQQEKTKLIHQIWRTDIELKALLAGHLSTEALSPIALNSKAPTQETAGEH